MRKRLSYAAGGLFLLAVAAAVLVRLVDLDAYKPRLETAASSALGMEFRVAGKMGIGLLPGFHVRLEGVTVRNRGADIVSAKEARFGVAILPLLRREVRIDRIDLRGPRLSVERDRHGTFNFEKTGEESRKGPPPDSGKGFPALAVGRITLRDGSVHYRDRRSGKEISAEGLDFAAAAFRIAPPGRAKDVSFTASLSCQELRAGNVVVTGLRSEIRAGDGVFDVAPLSGRLFGGEGTASLRADLSDAVPRFDVRASLPAFRAEEILKAVSTKVAGTGPMAFSAQLSGRGKTLKEVTESAGGMVSLRGENLALDGIDIDRALSRYESSQSFDLVDAGAFLLAGPFGPALTKGYDFANVFRGVRGKTRIRKLVSDWDVERGAARARDVALSTDGNRLALKGRLDFVGERFDDVVVAAVDAGGCATLRQKIRGPFRKPEVEKVSVLRSIAGPVLKLFRQTRELVAGKECEPFYTGSVPPPK